MSDPAIMFGDVVECTVPGFPLEVFVVIGVTKYSDHVLVLADEKAIGMAVSANHCFLYGEYNGPAATRLRARYLAKYPGNLKAMRGDL